MKITGHKTRSVFERYSITSANDVREAVACGSVNTTWKYGIGSNSANG